MIFSGPKSYYDEYVRKSGTQRTLTDPSSLLTDRGAYVNFLEVQLERVSAACLGVQAYDQRFNDMQNLIVALEQRCDTTNKLLGLVQQSVEGSNADYVERYEKLLSTVNANESTSLSVMQVVSDRVASTEQTLASMSGIQAHMGLLERKLTSNEELLEGIVRKADEERNSIEIKTADTLLKVNELYSKIDALSAQASRNQFNFDDYKSRQSTSMMSLENKINDSIAREREEVSSKIKNVGVTIETESEKLKREIEKCSADVAITMQQHKADVAVALRENESTRSQDDEILGYITTEMQTMSEAFKGEFEKIRKEVKSENENTLKLYDDLKRLEETVTGHVDVIESLESKTKEVEGFKLQEQIQEDRGDSMGGSSATAMDEGLLAKKIAEHNRQFLKELLDQGVLGHHGGMNMIVHGTPGLATSRPMTTPALQASLSAPAASSSMPLPLPMSPAASSSAPRSQSPNTALLYKGDISSSSQSRASNSVYEEREEVPSEGADFSRRRSLLKLESSLETKLVGDANAKVTGSASDNSDGDGDDTSKYDDKASVQVEDEEDELPCPPPFNSKREAVTQNQHHEEAKFMQESIDRTIQQAFGKFMDMYKEDQEQMNEKLETILELQVDTVTDANHSPERPNVAGKHDEDTLAKGTEKMTRDNIASDSANLEDASVRSQSSREYFQHSVDEMFPLQAKLKKQREVGSSSTYKSPYTGVRVSLDGGRNEDKKNSTDSRATRSKSASKSVTSADFRSSSNDDITDDSSTSSDFFETVFHHQKSKMADFMRGTALSSGRMPNVRPPSFQQPWLPTTHNLNEKVTSEKLKILSKRPTRMALARGHGRSISAQSVRTRSSYDGEISRLRTSDSIISKTANDSDRQSSSVDTEKLMKNDDAIRDDVFMALRNARALDRSISPKMDNLRGSGAIVKRSSAVRSSAKW